MRVTAAVALLICQANSSPGAAGPVEKDFAKRLERWSFLNSGTVWSTDVYELSSITSIYNEGYTYMGQGHDDWSNLGTHWSGLDYLMKVVKPKGECNATVLGYRMDIPKNDIKQVRLPVNSSYQDCATLCCANPRCEAFLFEPETDVKMGPCVIGEPCCFLKSKVSKPVPKNISSVVATVPSHHPSSQYVTPPSGMRSSVPLGPLGEGSIELRADGRLADWGTILNNGPYTADRTFSYKIEFDDAAFGVYTSVHDKGCLLRTHAPPSMASAGADLSEGLTYSGAFPVSQLVVNCSALGTELPLHLTLTAFSEFEPYNINNSIAPIIFFDFSVGNSFAFDRNVSIFFNLPNVIEGIWDSSRQIGNDMTLFTLAKDSSSSVYDQLTSGNFTVSVLQADGISTTVGPSLSANWDAFVQGGGVFHSPSGDRGGHGAIAAKVLAAAGSTTHVTLALSWYFPHRLWGNEDLGHYYSNFFSSSEDVVVREAKRLNDVTDAIEKWHTICFRDGLPEFLQDSLVNSAATWGKTAMFLRDGRWRQFESHSCSQMEPPHIHFYRALGFQLFFSDVERQTPHLYIKAMGSDGLVSERFGCICSTCPGEPCNLDVPDHGPRGDDNPVFVLDIYMNWKWHPTDGLAFLQATWNATALASRFIISHAKPYNLTFHMVNTNDEHSYIGDINSYNAFLYLASTAACMEMAGAVHDEDMETQCRVALEAGKVALQKLLWKEEGEFWGQTWCENGVDGTWALQGGELYGLLWSYVLGLAPTVDIPVEQVASHLMQERQRNLSPLGLIFATNRTADIYHGCHKKAVPAVEGDRSGFVDQDVWNSHSMTHAALSLFTRTGGAPDALNVSSLVINAYRETMADQWDYRDTTTPYNDDTGEYDPNGVPRPSVNSHYGRQTIFWALPLALSGQQFDGGANTLHLDLPDTQSYPVFLPSGNAISRRETTSDCLYLTPVAGSFPQGLHVFLHGREVKQRASPHAGSWYYCP